VSDRIQEELDKFQRKVKEELKDVKPRKKQVKYLVWIGLVLVFLVLMAAIVRKVFGASFATGTASESITTSNVVILGACLYGDGTNSSNVYFMDDSGDGSNPATVGDGTGDNIKSDTLYIAAGERGPVCITYASEGGISCTGLVCVLGGTGGRYGITFDKR